MLANDPTNQHVLTMLLCCLLLLCPAAATYIAFKGMVFTLRSISGTLPYLHNLLSVTLQHVTQQA
jgi:hypothetical protein